MFEEEFTRKVKNALDNSRKEREKAVQEWSNDMQKSYPAGRTETRGQGEDEDGTRRFQFPKTSSMGEDMGSASPRLVTVSCGKKLSRDVAALVVELSGHNLALPVVFRQRQYYQQLPMQLLLSAHVSDCTRDSDRDWH